MPYIAEKDRTRLEPYIRDLVEKINAATAEKDLEEVKTYAEHISTIIRNITSGRDPGAFAGILNYAIIA